MARKKKVNKEDNKGIILAASNDGIMTTSADDFVYESWTNAEISMGYEAVTVRTPLKKNDGKLLYIGVAEKETETSTEEYKGKHTNPSEIKVTSGKSWVNITLGNIIDNTALEIFYTIEENLSTEQRSVFTTFRVGDTDRILMFYITLAGKPGETPITFHITNNTYVTIKVRPHWSPAGAPVNIESSPKVLNKGESIDIIEKPVLNANFNYYFLHVVSNSTDTYTYKVTPERVLINDIINNNISFIVNYENNPEFNCSFGSNGEYVLYWHKSDFTGTRRKTLERIGTYTLTYNYLPYDKKYKYKFNITLNDTGANYEGFNDIEYTVEINEGQLSGEIINSNDKKISCKVVYTLTQTVRSDYSWPGKMNFLGRGALWCEILDNDNNKVTSISSNIEYGIKVVED